MTKTYTLILGGSGLIGSHLCKAWADHSTENQHEIYVLSRSKKSFPYAQVVQDFAALPDVDFSNIVNLTGATVGKRWTEHYKQTIRTSRIETTNNLVAWLKTRKKKPKVWLQASAIGYYGARDDSTPLDENSLAEQDFIHHLCKDWEDAAYLGKDLVERQCIIRIGVVLAEDGGMVSELKVPLSLGLGGRFGKGEQILSWIAIDDLVRIFTFLKDQADSEGVFNGTAPHPVSNKEFIRTAAGILKRPAFFHMPEKVVAMLFGDMGRHLLLKGQYVKPQRLIDAGFSWEHPTLKTALQKALLPATGIRH